MTASFPGPSNLLNQNENHSFYQGGPVRPATPERGEANLRSGAKRQPRRLHLAFGIVKLFPGGGLQRDCVEIARQVQDLGHDVTIFTSRFDDGDFARGLTIKLLPSKARTNHSRQERFSEDFFRARSTHFDLAVGFDKLAGLDVLYCADPSVLWRLKHSWHLFLRPLYRAFVRLERHTFKRGGSTRVLLQDAHQLENYTRAWRTEPDRLTLLPPTVAIERQRPEFRANHVRDRVRKQLGLTASNWTWISILVQPGTKGLDRSLYALQRFPQAQLLIAGLHTSDGSARRYAHLADALGVAQQVHWLGHREDIPELMAAADLLIHPARYDTTGTVILEAIVNELPVVATQACGHAGHLAAAKAGIVVREPFDFNEFFVALEQAQQEDRCREWAANARGYAQNHQFNRGKLHASRTVVAAAEQQAAQLRA
jgi:UDP-glucose:(heptosyl)LPS alpha-1,3-glucosyltransferase